MGSEGTFGARTQYFMSHGNYKIFENIVDSQGHERFIDGDINLGNIFESNLVDIINSQRVKDMQESFRNNKLIEDLFTPNFFTLNMLLFGEQYGK